MAASNIAKLFKAFPDLEEDAINALYDLCEDQDPNVRRAGNITHRPYESGYEAIVRVSEEQPRWLERNVDVLAQLLQSYEPEVTLDSNVTLGILCDQIVPSDDPMDDEDKTIRALVVAFLAQDARKPLLAQLQGQGRGTAEQGDALVDTLVKAVPILRSGRGEDILLFLPSFNDGQPTRRGSELVHLLLARATSGRTLRPGGTQRAWSSPRPSPVKSGSSESDLARLLSSRMLRNFLNRSAWTAAQRDISCLGNQKLGWMAIGFGRNMGDSPMVVVWRSHGADGEYNSVALARRRTRSCRRRICTLRSPPSSRSPPPPQSCFTQLRVIQPARPSREA
ncbi:hypothetical protein EDB83DRAFT_2555580, partial [Lactarius deliciosus]